MIFHEVNFLYKIYTRVFALFQHKFYAAKLRRRICAAFGIAAVSKRTVQDWFKHICDGGTNMEDRSYLGPSEIDEGCLWQVVKPKNECSIHTSKIVDRFWDIGHRLKPDFIIERPCCVFGRIVKVLFIGRYFHQTPRLLGLFTVNKWKH